MHIDSLGHVSSLGQVMNSLDSLGPITWQVQGGGAPAVGVLLSSLVDRRPDAAGLSLSLSLSLSRARALSLPLSLSLHFRESETEQQ